MQCPMYPIMPGRWTPCCAGWTAGGPGSSFTPAAGPVPARCWSSCASTSEITILYYNPNIWPDAEYHPAGTGAGAVRGAGPSSGGDGGGGPLRPPGILRGRPGPGGRARSGAAAAPPVTGCGCAGAAQYAAQHGFDWFTYHHPVHQPPQGRRPDQPNRAGSWPPNTGCPTCPPTSKRRTATCAPCSCRPNTDCIARITAAASSAPGSPRQSGTPGPGRIRRLLPSGRRATSTANTSIPTQGTMLEAMPAVRPAYSGHHPDDPGHDDGAQTGRRQQDGNGW